MKRVVLVVLDGLRPDAIHAFGLAALAELARRGASTLRATTVGPSVTAACMTSLLTGVSPETHGIRSSRFRLVKRHTPLRPIPAVLGEHALPSAAYLCEVPWWMRGVARRIARALKVDATFAGRDSSAVVAAALPTLRALERGLVLLHWPDGDDAGHAHGWMTERYGHAARRMDASLRAVIDALDPFEREDTLLIAMADHGGGGAELKDHESAHPLDRTIPILFGGGAVPARTLLDPVSLLDVPPTVLWALGAPVPGTYHGRPLLEVFGRDPISV